MKATGIMLGGLVMFVLGVYSGAALVITADRTKKENNKEHTCKKPEETNGFKECTIKGFCE